MRVNSMCNGVVFITENLAALRCLRLFPLPLTLKLSPGICAAWAYVEKHSEILLGRHRKGIAPCSTWCPSGRGPWWRGRSTPFHQFIRLSWSQLSLELHVTVKQKPILSARSVHPMPSDVTSWALPKNFLPFLQEPLLLLPQWVGATPSQSTQRPLPMALLPPHHLLLLTKVYSHLLIHRH